MTKIEGAAVEESAKVFFEGIVDAKPNPKFNWFFDDEPIIPGNTTCFETRNVTKIKNFEIKMSIMLAK